MKKITLVFLLIASMSLHAQTASNIPATSNKDFAFKKGEWIRFRMSYSNFLNAGFATFEVRETTNKGKEAFHIIGKGKSTGVVSLFFNVKDDYQSFIYKESLKPYRFIRKIDEGGHTKDKEIWFDYDKNEATVKNNKHNTIEKYPIHSDIQDMLSSLYFLRNRNLNSLKEGDEIKLNMFFDQEVYNFRLRFLGKEVINTKFGKVNALKLRPMVQAGRVFKEEESVTVWISDDKNKIPLKIKASLAVGSLRADIDAFKGLSHPFNIIFDN
ncbi:DUF3108 domain-containing protein [Lutibacter sp. B1]|uniref:DUF3108 domain-containing protein n=1 Tax=Lutibacter sp. B1 TaxID=2725996 RepID=UPI0014574A70|nr:DUF3108 domain-containing protein [Lutibacter sp. B1]NLP57612.1 DUF3108 domain-containing protein [Lutibacter sp. B1]